MFSVRKISFNICWKVCLILFIYGLIILFYRLVASIEYYEVEANKWIMGRPMDNPRMGMACAVKDDHIWCMGGIGVSEDLETYPVLSSVISYDINNKQYVF